MEMPARAHETLPLTLSEQLDAMLLGWLEHRAGRDSAQSPATRARALISVVEQLVPEIEAFCERWDMTVERAPVADASWAVLYVDGPVLPVEGFSAITGMYRR
jgi:hypothetical protein